MVLPNLNIVSSHKILRSIDNNPVFLNPALLKLQHQIDKHQIGTTTMDRNNDYRDHGQRERGHRDQEDRTYRERFYRDDRDRDYGFGFNPHHSSQAPPGPPSHPPPGHPPSFQRSPGGRCYDLPRNPSSFSANPNPRANGFPNGFQQDGFQTQPNLPAQANGFQQDGFQAQSNPPAQANGFQQNVFQAQPNPPAQANGNPLTPQANGNPPTPDPAQANGNPRSQANGNSQSQSNHEDKSDKQATAKYYHSSDSSTASENEIEVVDGATVKSDLASQKNLFVHGYNSLQLETRYIQEPFMTEKEKMNALLSYTQDRAEEERRHATCVLEISDQFLKRTGARTEYNGKQTIAYPSKYVGKPGAKSLREVLHDQLPMSGRRKEYVGALGDNFTEVCLGKPGNIRSCCEKEGLKEIRSVKEIRKRKAKSTEDIKATSKSDAKRANKKTKNKKQD